MRHARLKAYADDVDDAEVETRNAILEESVDAILDFVRRDGRQTFPFIFIDPTGWTGFAMDTIAPLLSVKPGEVLINLMTKDVRRFIESPEQQTQASFDRLFGRPGVKERVAGLQGLDRDDAVVDEYQSSVRQFGGFRYVCSAIVLHSERNRTHFHLIYATRHRKGVEVFKEAERKAMEVQEAARARGPGPPSARGPRPQFVHRRGNAQLCPLRSASGALYSAISFYRAEPPRGEEADPL